MATKYLKYPSICIEACIYSLRWSFWYQHYPYINRLVQFGYSHIACGPTLTTVKQT